MAITLHPQTQNGIMVWTPTTLVLHLLWAWQFALYCAGEVFLLFAVAMATDLGWTRDSGVPFWIWIIFVITLILAITVIVEVCIYANDNLSPLVYLGLQTFKLVYAIVIFVLFLVFLSHSADSPDLKRLVFGLVVFCPPWFMTFSLAVFIYLSTSTSKDQKAAESLENGHIDAPTERAPLLPSQIPSPRLPSQRIAVQRYPS